LRVLTLTNLYPTEADPTFGTFVGDQVNQLRTRREIERCDVLFINGRDSRWSYLAAIFRLTRALRRTPVDVVHAHYGLTGAIAVIQRAVPTVVTYHTGDLEGPRWQRRISRLVYRLAADNIAVSRHAACELPGPAHHVPCAVDLTLFRPLDRSAARRAFGVPEGALAVLFPSSPLRAEKAYPRFAEVIQVLRRRGHEVYELQLRNLHREQVPVIMAAADAMVLTSTREGSPVSVMEALACGLGIVATPVGDVPPILRQAENAHVLEFDAHAFADAVEQVAAADKTPRRADPESGRFASQEITDRIIAVLAGAVEGRRQRRRRQSCA
jgi:teichuronic acid biosynthesis glycosyltransferase TuaC